MQRSFGDPSLSWSGFVYLALAGFLGYLARAGHKWVLLWLERKKPIAEVHESQARTTEITVRSHSTAGDAVIRFMDRLDEAQQKIDTLRDERDLYKQETEKQRIEIEFADKQLKRIMGILEIKGIKLSDYDIRK